MNGTDFLSFAKSIYKSTEEAARRSAVSRSYYALYHNVKQNFINMGIVVSNSSDEHKRLARCLVRSGIVDAITVGQSMSDLRAARNDADYDLSVNTFNDLTCGLHCAKAESAISMLSRIDKTALYSALRNSGTGCV